MFFRCTLKPLFNSVNGLHWLVLVVPSEQLFNLKHKNNFALLRSDYLPNFKCKQCSDLFSFLIARVYLVCQ